MMRRRKKVVNTERSIQTIEEWERSEAEHLDKSARLAREAGLITSGTTPQELNADGSLKMEAGE